MFLMCEGTIFKGSLEVKLWFIKILCYESISYSLTCEYVLCTVSGIREIEVDKTKISTFMDLTF